MADEKDFGGADVCTEPWEKTSPELRRSETHGVEHLEDYEQRKDALFLAIVRVLGNPVE